jgi:hypothetical protein
MLNEYFEDENIELIDSIETLPKAHRDALCKVSDNEGLEFTYVDFNINNGITTVKFKLYGFCFSGQISGYGKDEQIYAIEYDCDTCKYNPIEKLIKDFENLLNKEEGKSKC